MGRIQLQEFDISLNGNKKVYKTGERIDGIVLIVLDGELNLNNLKVRLRGEAQVKWTKTKWVTSSNDRQSRNITYEQILSILTEHFDVTQTVKDNILRQGVHQIPFRFQLPEEVPNSFKGEFGQIHYWVEAEIEKALLSWNHECQTKFSICSPLKATTNAPVVYQKLQNYCCCFVKRGFINVEISILENAFNGGDMIPISYDINNRRSLPIKVKATLVERHIFRANGKRKDSIQKHISTAGPVIDALNQSIGVIQVPIPANTRPSVKSRLIEVNYFVNICIDDKSGLDFNFPVIVMHTNSCENNNSEN